MRGSILLSPLYVAGSYRFSSNKIMPKGDSISLVEEQLYSKPQIVVLHFEHNKL